MKLLREIRHQLPRRLVRLLQSIQMAPVLIISLSQTKTILSACFHRELMWQDIISLLEGDRVWENLMSHSRQDFKCSQALSLKTCQTRSLPRSFSLITIWRQHLIPAEERMSSTLSSLASLLLCLVKSSRLTLTSPGTGVQADLTFPNGFWLLWNSQGFLKTSEYANPKE